MRYLLLTLATCLFAFTTQAQPDEEDSHLKKENPETLFVEFYEDRHCGWNLEPVVNGEMEKAGINRKGSWDFDELVLYVNIYCIENENSEGELLSYVYDMNVAFGHYVRTESHIQGVYVRMHIEPAEYSTFGVVTNDETGRKKMRDSLREITDKALADYKEANAGDR